MRPLLVLMLALAACAQPQWHKPGTSQAVLAVDMADCGAAADAQARAASFSGRDVIASVRKQALAQCLRQRGWSEHQDLLPEVSFPAAPPLEPPADFKPLADDLLPGAWAFTATDGSRLDMVLQRAPKGFTDQPFPAPPELILYDRGEVDTPHGDARWALFHGPPGRTRNSWQAAFGAYIVMNKTERLVITAALPLPAPGPGVHTQTTPLPGLTTVTAQRQYLEQLLEYFLAWLTLAPGGPNTLQEKP